MALSGLNRPRRERDDSKDDDQLIAATPGRSGMRRFTDRYVLACTAACISETVTYPLDLAKTRLQIQGEKARYHVEGSSGVIPQRGFWKTTFGIVNEEGFFKLWQGLSPAIYRHAIYTGCRMAFYELLRENVLGKEKDGSFPLWKAIAGGLIAGGLGQFLASPADLVKVQMQAEGRRRLEGKTARVKGPWHAFSKILREGGVRGLWKGWVPNVQRAALVNMGDLTTYDTAKQFILKHTALVDNSLTHFLSSCCAGLVSASLGTPADVVKTRVMNQPTENGKGVLYTSSIDCLVKTVRQEGFLALYKGFFPIWARMAPWSLIFWLSYEQIRRLAGVQGF